MIEINVSKIVKNFGFKNILNELSFEVKTGEIVSIIGENGCGKTTILNIISGLERADSGLVTTRKDSKIGYLNQMTSKRYSL